MFCLISISLALILGYYLILLVTLNILKLKNRQNNKTKIAFFHPFCNDGGGGQKVLWCILQAIFKSNKGNQQACPEITIYSLFSNKEQMLQKVKTRFSIDLIEFSNQINIIHIPGRSLLIPQPKLTMLLHMILPKIYCLMCLFKYQPDIFYDTTGFASTLFMTKVLLPTTKTVAYVHYPFISLDMIQKVKERRADFNNDQRISNSSWKTSLKLVYYWAVFYGYQLNGYFVDYAQTNSTWTHGHMRKIWSSLDRKGKLLKLYPPCSVEQLLKFDKKTDLKEVNMMSLAQFRPQKNHKLQIRVLKRLVELLEEQKNDKPLKLYICGTTRGPDDQKILSGLMDLVEELSLKKNVEFKVNKPFSQILSTLESSQIGIHTMEAEHFGISVVQMLAAGLIVVAHNSAGPKQDIIKDQRFLATDEDSYFEKMKSIFRLTPSAVQEQIASNRQRAKQFGEVAFQKQFIKCLHTMEGKSDKND